MSNGESTGNGNAAAGWYDDGSGRQRYWDGAAWTDSFADAPAAAGPAGVPQAAAPKRTLWPWLVAGGGVLLLLLIGVVVLVVALLLPLGSGPQSTIERYNKAWWTADCTAFVESTTQDYRDDFVTSDGEPFSCEVFVEQAKEFYAGAKNLDISVTSSDVEGDTATVTAIETGAGEDGAEYSDRWTYTLVREDGRWLIDTEDNEDVQD